VDVFEKICPPNFSVHSVFPFPHAVVTAWSRVWPEKLAIPKRIKEFLAFYGARWFITVFTRAHNLSLSTASWIQFTLWNPVFQNSNPCQSRSVLLCDTQSTNLLHPSWIQKFSLTFCH